MIEAARQTRIRNAQPAVFEAAMEQASTGANAVKKLLSRLKTRDLIFALCTITVLLIYGFVLSNIKHVKIMVGSKVTQISTFSTNPADILKKCNISTTKYDKIKFSGFTGNTGTLQVVPAVEVHVVADHKTRDVMVAEGTVADALTGAQVTVGKEDLVSAPLDEQVTAGDTIIVKRVTYETKTVIKPIAFKTVKQPTFLLQRGAQQQIAAGKTGQKAITTKVKYIDGKAAEQKLLKETVKVKPLNRVLAAGTAATTPLSKLYFSGLKLDANGKPANYSHVYTGLATAYSAHKGARTASGRLAGVGYVAVDTRKIPFGTRLYIMTPDGSYVYGTAVSADTGAFVHNGSNVLVDLYFPSRASSCRFGERTVKIYVLK